MVVEILFGRKVEQKFMIIKIIKIRIIRYNMLRLNLCVKIMK